MDPIALPFELPPVLLLVGALIPFATAALTRWQAPDWIKGLVTVTLAAAAALLRAVIDKHLALTWNTFAVTFVTLWCTALVTWLGGTSDLTAKLNQKTGTFGIGTAPAVEPIKPTPPPAP